MVDQAQAAAAAADATARDARRARVVAAAGVALPALGLLGAWASAWAWRAWPGVAWWPDAALTAAPWAALLGVWGVALLGWLRAQGTAGAALAALGAVAALAIAPAALALGLTCNGLWGGEAEDRRVVVAGTTREGEAGAAIYLLHLRSWRASHGETVDVRLTPRAFAQARVGQWVIVTTRRGGLGAEWVEAVCVAPGVCLALDGAT